MTERIPDFSLEKIIDLDPKYHKALGQFIEAYATCEMYLYFLLQKIAGVSPEIGAAIFSGVRTEQAISFIRRIWLVQEPAKDVRKELDEAMKQLAAINDARNVMVHHASNVYFGYGRVVNNKTRANTKDNVKEYRVSPEILEGMLQDCFRISVTFLKHIHPGSYAEDSEYLKHAWRYKPTSNPQKTHGQQGLKGRKGS